MSEHDPAGAEQYGYQAKTFEGSQGVKDLIRARNDSICWELFFFSPNLATIQT